MQDLLPKNIHSEVKEMKLMALSWKLVLLGKTASTHKPDGIWFHQG